MGQNLTKCSYDQVRKAILEYGVSKANVARSLNVCVMTLEYYLKRWPRLRKLLDKMMKKAPEMLEGRVLGLLAQAPTKEGEEDFIMTPTGCRYLIRYLSNTIPDRWAANKKTETTVNTNVSINEKREISVTDERLSQALSNVKARHPELIEKAEKMEAREIGFKELPQGEVIENQSPPDNEVKKEG